MSALPVRNRTSPCSPSRTALPSTRVFCAVSTLRVRSSSRADRLLLVSVSWLLSLSSAVFSVCSSVLSVCNAATFASAWVASPARCTRFPSQVPKPAPTNAPTGPAAKAPITAPETNPIGSCGVAGFGSSAMAAVLMANSPIAPMVLENALFINAPLLQFARRRRPPPRRNHYGPGFGRCPSQLGANDGEAAMNSTRARGPRPGARRSGFQREGREIGVGVVVILVFRFFQERNDAVRGRRRDDLPAALQEILGEHDLDEVRLRHASIKGDEIKNHRVHQLAAQGRADDPGPQPTAPGPDLHLREHVAVHEGSA